MRSFDSELEKFREQSLFRELRTLDSPQDVTVEHEGRTLLNFSSNDYLGFANDPAVREAFHAAIDAHGAGAGASRLVSGSLAPHRDLEDALAAFTGHEAALTFSTGFAAAHGVLGSLLEKNDVVILDKLCHASLVDAARFSGAQLRVYPHLDTEKLESHLAWARMRVPPEGRVLVVTEAVFSMDGDRAPLPEIVSLTKNHGALLLVDEAHALGVLGHGGRGLASELGVSDGVDILMGTLGKSVGLSGGFLAGSADFVSLLINRARSFIYSTAPPPALAATAATALQLLQSSVGESRRERLWANIRHCHSALHPDATDPPQSAILPHILGDEDQAMEVSKKLFTEGLLVPAIRYPTVARGTARLRITLSANHTTEQIDALVEALSTNNPKKSTTSSEAKD